MSLLFLIVPFLSAQAEEIRGSDEETRRYIQELEKRVSELEAIVKGLLEEKKIPPTTPSEEALQEKKPETPPTVKDEWEEPVVEKEPIRGRDEDARRRITEIETWRRRLEAKTAKEEEEEVEKVKFDFSGKYKLRLNIRDNLNLNNPRQYWQYDNYTYLDQRLQLKIDATYGPFTSVLVLDKGNFVFDWKEDSEGTLDRWSEFHTVNAALVRELYLQYIGDFVFKAGRQTIIVGNGGIVLEGPVDAIKITYPIGKTPVGMLSPSLTYIAVSGGYKDYTDFRRSGPPSGDRSAVFGIANKLDGWLLSLDIKPKRGLTIEPYILKVYDRGGSGNPDLNLDKDFNSSTMSRDGHFEPLWLGTAISGIEKNVSYEADIIYLTGSYTDRQDISAYAFLLRGDYIFKQLGSLKNFSLGLEFGRGSGNKAEDSETTDEIKDFSGLWLCKDRRKFGNIFSEDLRGGYFLWDSNLANVTFVGGIVGFEPVKKLEANLALTKLWTTESVFKGQGPVRDWSMGMSTTTEKTKDIGWEIDMNLAFPLYKERLRGFTEIGYFIPGDVYQRADGQKSDPASEIVIGAEFEF
ncbi:MAG: hypothetical protein A3K22_03890 [Deltaproteobacteria bacterium RBG_16_42_7]|nr:MAG: hypothetical protein A3K22_03890 [Deltaproteobacteria bacterium RBG_16_42_7]